MRSTATELGTPRTMRVLGEIERVDAREPRVPGRLGELRPHRAVRPWPTDRPLLECPRCRSPGLSTGVSTSVEKQPRRATTSTPRPSAQSGRFGEVPDARGRPERWGRGRYQRRREPHKPRQWASVHTVHGRKTPPQGRDPQRPRSGATGLFRQVGTPYTAPSRRPRSCTDCALDQAPCLIIGAAPPPGPFSPARAFEEAMREEDVPTEQPEAEEEARLPTPHADARRSRRDHASAVQGPRPPVGLIWPRPRPCVLPCTGQRCAPPAGSPRRDVRSPG